MICDPCKRAGEALIDGERKEAVELHEQCEAPATCPCHHRIDGVIINPERTQNDTPDSAG